jgi:hypothetical protein
MLRLYCWAQCYKTFFVPKLRIFVARVFVIGKLFQSSSLVRKSVNCEQFFYNIGPWACLRRIIKRRMGRARFGLFFSYKTFFFVKDSAHKLS